MEMNRSRVRHGARLFLNDQELGREVADVEVGESSASAEPSVVRRRADATAETARCYRRANRPLPEARHRSLQSVE